MKRDALYNMIEQQIRPWDVHDVRVLQLLRDLPRAQFLPATHSAFAYMDTALPLWIEGVDMHTQLHAPRVLARIVQAVSPQLHESVALIGVGDGYLTALVAQCAKIVTVFEANPNILAFAQNNLNQHGIRNINYEPSAGLAHRVEKHDVVIINGSIPVVTDALKQALNIGGRLFCIVGQPQGMMHASIITRISQDQWHTHLAFELSAVPMQYGAQPPSNNFQF
jgi:protein-L-isoaspartate(D-aspartate) O-methyltransferase